MPHIPRPAPFAHLSQHEFTSVEIDPRKTKIIEELWNTANATTDIFISRLNAAKEEILMKVITEIEGRPTVLHDARNLELATVVGEWQKTYVRYKGEYIGFISVDLMTNTVVFIPQ